MVKRTRSSDTAVGAAQAFIEAAKGLAKVPRHVSLRPRDQPFWEAIVSNKSRDEWTEVQLVAAVQLARTQADIHDWMDQMDSEEPVLFVGPQDTPRANPLLAVIETATRRELALFRALGIASTEDPRDAQRRQQSLRSAREARDKLKSDPLLAS